MFNIQQEIIKANEAYRVAGGLPPIEPPKETPLDYYDEDWEKEHADEGKEEDTRSQLQQIRDSNPRQSDVR